MSRLALVAILVIAAIGITLQYFADDLRALLDIQPSDPLAAIEEPEVPRPRESTVSDRESEPGGMAEDLKVEETVSVTEDKLELVRDIVERRFPMPVLEAFEAVVGDWSDLPPDVFPAQVEVVSPVELFEKTASGVVAQAFVVAGGRVRPVSSDGEMLAVESLAREQLKGSIRVADSNFREALRQRYDRALKEARERVEAMREADFEWLAERRHVVDRLQREDRIWDDNERQSSRYASILESVAAGRAGAAGPGDVKKIFVRGPQIFDRDGFFGQYTTTLVYFEVNDAGFGVLPYYSLCLMTGSVVVGWIDPVPAWDEGS